MPKKMATALYPGLLMPKIVVMKFIWTKNPKNSPTRSKNDASDPVGTSVQTQNNSESKSKGQHQQHPRHLVKWHRELLVVRVEIILCHEIVVVHAIKGLRSVLNHAGIDESARQQNCHIHRWLHIVTGEKRNVLIGCVREEREVSSEVCVFCHQLHELAAESVNFEIFTRDRLTKLLRVCFDAAELLSKLFRVNRLE
jgi:hypothetical protein